MEILQEEEILYDYQNSNLMDHFELEYQILFNGSQPLNEENYEQKNRFIVHLYNYFYLEDENKKKYIASKLKRSKSFKIIKKNKNCFESNAKWKSSQTIKTMFP